MPDDPGYRKFYELERYLFGEVRTRFAQTGKIDPADFYMIVIWKANRAKTRIRDKLGRREGGFAASVKHIAAALHASGSPMNRLEILMKEWRFALPMAGAVLTVLYPEDFGIYDVRVCGQLKERCAAAFEKLAHRRFSDRLWNDYQAYLEAVKAAAPQGLSLRDKDRYLWGRSFYEGVRKTCKADPSARVLAPRPPQIQAVRHIRHKTQAAKQASFIHGHVLFVYPHLQPVAVDQSAPAEQLFAAHVDEFELARDQHWQYRGQRIERHGQHGFEAAAVRFDMADALWLFSPSNYPHP